MQPRPINELAEPPGVTGAWVAWAQLNKCRFPSDDRFAHGVCADCMGTIDYISWLVVRAPL